MIEALPLYKEKVVYSLPYACRLKGCRHRWDILPTAIEVRQHFSKAHKINVVSLTWSSLRRLIYAKQ